MNNLSFFGLFLVFLIEFVLVTNAKVYNVAEEDSGEEQDSSGVNSSSEKEQVSRKPNYKRTRNPKSQIEVIRPLVVATKPKPYFGYKAADFDRNLYKIRKIHVIEEDDDRPSLTRPPMFYAAHDTNRMAVSNSNRDPKCKLVYRKIRTNTASNLFKCMFCYDPVSMTDYENCDIVNPFSTLGHLRTRRSIRKDKQKKRKPKNNVNRASSWFWIDSDEFFDDTGNDSDKRTKSTGNNNCLIVQKGDTTCEICRNPKNGHKSKKCSYSTHPKDSSYSFVSESSYRTKNRPDRSSEETDDTDDDDDDRNESKPKKMLALKIKRLPTSIQDLLNNDNVSTASQVLDSAKQKTQTVLNRMRNHGKKCSRIRKGSMICYVCDRNEQCTLAAKSRKSIMDTEPAASKTIFNRSDRRAPVTFTRKSKFEAEFDQLMYRF